jgi:hypothetical protein
MFIFVFKAIITTPIVGSSALLSCAVLIVVFNKVLAATPKSSLALKNCVSRES